jgi:hypothetical protein
MRLAEPLPDLDELRVLEIGDMLDRWRLAPKRSKQLVLLTLSSLSMAFGSREPSRYLFGERLFRLRGPGREETLRQDGLPLSVTDTLAAQHVLGASSGAVCSLRAIRRAAGTMSNIASVGLCASPRDWTRHRALCGCTTAVVSIAATAPRSGRAALKPSELYGTQPAFEELLQRPSLHYSRAKMPARGLGKNDA